MQPRTAKGQHQKKIIKCIFLNVPTMQKTGLGLWPILCGADQSINENPQHVSVTEAKINENNVKYMD